MLVSLLIQVKGHTLEQTQLKRAAEYHTLLASCKVLATGQQCALPCGVEMERLPDKRVLPNTKAACFRTFSIRMYAMYGGKLYLGDLMLL